MQVNYLKVETIFFVFIVLLYLQCMYLHEVNVVQCLG